MPPFKSQAQRRYFEANKPRLMAEGVDVAEWERASKGKKLPERLAPKPPRPKKGKKK